MRGKSKSGSSKKRGQDVPEDADVQDGRDAAKKVSKKSRRAEGTAIEDPGPREARQRQDKLSRDEREQQEPVDRGSAGKKTVDKAAGSKKTNEVSRWDQRRQKTFEDWANEKNKENEERRSRAIEAGSKAKKKKTGKAFTAKD